MEAVTCLPVSFQSSLFEGFSVSDLSDSVCMHMSPFIVGEEKLVPTEFSHLCLLGYRLFLEVCTESAVSAKQNYWLLWYFWVSAPSIVLAFGLFPSSIQHSGFDLETLMSFWSFLSLWLCFFVFVPSREVGFRSLMIISGQSWQWAQKRVSQFQHNTAFTCALRWSGRCAASLHKALQYLPCLKQSADTVAALDTWML